MEAIALNQEPIRSATRKNHHPIRVAIAAVLGLALFQLTACAGWFAQADSSFVTRGNQICETEKAQTQSKWKALLGQSSEVSPDEKQNFVRNVFIPNLRQQVQKIGEIQIDVPEFGAVAKAELQAMTAAADSALATLDSNPALVLAEDTAEPLFEAMNTSAESLGLSQCTVGPLS